jgi:hypothetical protein
MKVWGTALGHHYVIVQEAPGIHESSIERAGPWFFPSPKIVLRPPGLADESDASFFEGVTFGEIAAPDVDDITF